MAAGGAKPVDAVADLSLRRWTFGGGVHLELAGARPAARKTLEQAVGTSFIMSLSYGFRRLANDSQTVRRGNSF